MLEQEIIEQLKTAFKDIKDDISFVYNHTTHADLPELLAMLNAVASTSSKFSVIKNQNSSDSLTFTIEKNNKPTGISFLGIPGGHEFTSFIVAILNTANLGKIPDDQILKRVKNLKGKINLKTYISLTCENCPDVVQALNLMTLVHDNFSHQMIDGAYTQDEITKLNIQGVPSVIHEGKLIHSGKISFIDLLTKLENHFGTEKVELKKEDLDLGLYDVVVVGGGPAGASAAIYSARKGLKTAILAERMGGQVQDTKGIENLISIIYTEGPQLAAQMAQHIASYPIKVLEHRRVKNVINDKIKKIELESGEFITTKSLIITTGAKWRELNIPGEKEYIGRGVAFCPHCDGPYYKGKKVAVVGGGNSGVEAAIDLAGIVREVILFEFNAELKADKILVDKLKSLPNVSILTNVRTEEVMGDGSKVIALKYEDRTSQEIKKVDLDGIFVQIGLIPNSHFIKDIVETTKFGEIIIDPKGRTSLPGIYAAGDVTTIPYKQIIIAMGEGAKVALASFEDQMLAS
jgi:alkyl hydroperoxide reductase subunit F